MKVNIISVIAAGSLISLFGGSTTATATLVNNGDFEVPSEVPMQMLPPNATIQGWTVVGNGDVTVHHVSANFGVWPGNDTQFMDLTGSTGGGGIRSDTIATVIGRSYQVSFDAFNGSLIYPGTAYVGPALSLQASGGSLATFSPLAGVQSHFNYLFVATSTTTDLTFMDLTGFDSNAGWIDNVSMIAVPEPATALAGILILLPLAFSTARILRRESLT